MSHRSIATWFALALLAGCQGGPGIPEHRYYRLQAAGAPGAQQALLRDELTVLPLRAEGLYGERAIVYSDAAQRTLQQYHYHHWLYPPERMVQEHLAERLRQAGIAPAVRMRERAGGARYAVSGRVLRFERIGGGNGKALATLELRLEQKGREVWHRTYAAEAEADDGGMAAFAAAMEQALDRIGGEFAGDLQRLKLE